jgi:hypothetical protein
MYINRLFNHTSHGLPHRISAAKAISLLARSAGPRQKEGPFGHFSFLLSHRNIHFKPIDTIKLATPPMAARMTVLRTSLTDNCISNTSNVPPVILNQVLPSE